MIKISNDLRENAHYNPTKETVRKSIEDLCKEVESGDIIMPIFQRDLAWTLEKKIELLNFQLNGPAPVSPVSMNKIGDKSMQMLHIELLSRNIVSDDDLNSKLGVIDGQQRISTNYEVYSNSPKIQDIVLNISDGEFKSTRRKIPKKNEIPAGVLYNKNPEVYSVYIEEHPDLAHFKVFSLLNQIRSKFFNYFYTVNYAKNLDGNQQVKWFNVLNLAGSRVPKIQMELTKLQIKGLDFYKSFAAPFQKKLLDAGYDNLFIQKNTEISIPLATLNPAVEVMLGKVHSPNFAPFASDAKEEIIVDLDLTQLEKCFEMTLNGLNAALNFISDNNLNSPSRIDYITYLTGYFVYKMYSNNDGNENSGSDLSVVQQKKLLDWYIEVDFVNASNTKRRDIFTNLLTI